MTGLTLNTKQDIYKGDMVTLCESLNKEYKGSCEFQPECISSFILNSSCFNSSYLLTLYSSNVI